MFSEFFEDNPDKYSKYGIYEKNCGLDKVLFSFGHDEYLYRVLKHNKCTIPDMGLKMIRYHSFYPWHDKGEYEYLMNKDNYELRNWCQRFSKSDLYTKDNNDVLDMNKLKPYYDGLIKKYFDKYELDW